MLYIGQVPFSSTEAQALKEARQTSNTQDWLLDVEAGDPEDRELQGPGALVPAPETVAKSLVVSTRRFAIMSARYSIPKASVR